MPDMEKVVNALHICFERKNCDGCSYADACRAEYDNKHENAHCPVMDDTIALLKEQDTVAPEFVRNEWRCGACGHVVLTYCFDINEGEMGKVIANYCPSCGRKVKWDDA